MAMGESCTPLAAARQGGSVWTCVASRSSGLHIRVSVELETSPICGFG